MKFNLKIGLVIVPIVTLTGCQSLKPVTSMFTVQSKVATAPATSTSRLQIMTNPNSQILATPNSTCYKSEIEGTGTVLTNYRGGLFKDPNNETLFYDLGIEKPSTLQKAIVSASAIGIKAFRIKDIDKEKFSSLYNVASQNGTVKPERWQEYSIASLPSSQQANLAKKTILTERYIETGKPISFSFVSTTSDGQYSCNIKSYFIPQANTDYRLIGEIEHQYSRTVCHLGLQQKIKKSLKWQKSVLQQANHKNC